MLAAQGKAILISSHILTELAEICNGAVFIERGKILRAGTLEELLAEDTHAPHRRRSAPLGRSSDLHRHLLRAARRRGGPRWWTTHVEVDVDGDEEALLRAAGRPDRARASGSSSSARSRPTSKRSS